MSDDDVEATAAACESATCLVGAGDGAGDICTTASWCRLVRVSDEDAASPVCLGRSPVGEGGRYYWLCRQCVIVYPGFTSERTARRMASSHCLLRWREHAVGRAVKAKRQAGLEANLTYEELRCVLEASPRAWQSHASARTGP